jgi:DNA modification methylase
MIQGNAQSLPLADCSVETVVTDPPYELGFMGKRWDASGVAFDPATWAEVLRVAKPGAFLLAFGGTRTWHRLACAIEDAGWIIRDCLMWMYSTGFPKSHDISKAIDKAGGISQEQQAALLKQKRESAGMSRGELAGVVGCTPSSIRDWEEGRARAKGSALEFIVPSPDYRIKLANCLGYTADERRLVGVSIDRRGDETTYSLGHSGDITKGGNTPLAQLWDGWGTALAPSWEPIIVAMKPLDGTFAQNAERHGVAGLWIDGGRIEGVPPSVPQPKFNSPTGRTYGMKTGVGRSGEMSHASGRWPPNCILDEHAAGLLDEQTADKLHSAGYKTDGKHCGGKKEIYTSVAMQGPMGPSASPRVGDSGGASRFFKVIEPDTRFFYVSKPSRAERDAGCYALEPRQRDDSRNADQPSMHGGKGNAYNRGAKPVRNPHPTTKPLALMRHLVRLTKTPTGGLVLDPFAGSGTTGMACVCEGRPFVGIDLEPEYVEIAKLRIAHVEKHGPNWDVDPRQVTIGETGQRSLFDEE